MYHTVIAQDVFVENPAHPMVRHICDPNASNREAMRMRLLIQVIPERLI